MHECMFLTLVLLVLFLSLIMVSTVYLWYQGWQLCWHIQMTSLEANGESMQSFATVRDIIIGLPQGGLCRWMHWKQKIVFNCQYKIK